jgi:hypothetical protein
VPPPVARRFPRLTLLLIFVALTVVHTWPLASAPATYTRTDRADAALNAWAIAWVAHQLPRAPTHLFDANIFYPDTLTLAYSEPLIVQSVIAWPVLALGGSPVLGSNVALLTGFILTGWAVALLLYRWTNGGMTAAIVAGSLAAFNAHSLTRLAHVQALHLEFLALALFALDQLLEHERWRHAALLGVAVALQGMASIYALVFTGWAVACAALASLSQLAAAARLRIAAMLVAAGALTAALMAPVLWPYYILSHTLGLIRTVPDEQRFASRWTDYLYTGARVHFDAWSHWFSSSTDANFPGVVAIVLAGVALAYGVRRRAADVDPDPQTRKSGAERQRHVADARHVRVALALVIGSVLLSVWPRLPSFEWAHDHVLGVAAIRAYSRAGQIALVGVALLAALGVERLRERWQNRRGWTALAAGLVVLVNVEALRAPIAYTTFEGIPDVYDALATETGAVLELPLYGPKVIFRNVQYLIPSTRHWRPIVGGYSGFIPPSFPPTWRALHDLPDPVSLSWLRAHGVTTIVLHRAQFEAEKGRGQLWKVEHSPELELMIIEGDVRIFRVKRPVN